MRYLIMILLAPLLLVANLLGGLSAFLVVGAVNGYETVMDLIEKATEE